MSDLSELLWDTYAHWKCADHGKTLDEHVREALAESGLAIVPVEPTEAMIGEGVRLQGARAVWTAMIRAAQETGT